MGFKGLQSVFFHYKLIDIMKPEDYIEKLKTKLNKDSVIVAVDVFTYLYKFKRNNEELNYILAFLNFCKVLLNLDIIPVFVFDGKIPYEKRFTINQRFKKRQKNKKKMMDEIEILKNHNIEKTTEEYKNKIDNLRKNTSCISIDDKENIIKLCQKMMLPIIFAKTEGETACAYLYNKGVVDAILTSDSDVLMYGCNIQIDFSNIVTYDKLKVYNKKKIMKYFKLNNKQFSECCLLCGCDYIKQFPNINKKDLFVNYNKYKSFSDFLHDNSNYYNIDILINKYNKTKMLYIRNIIKEHSIKIPLIKINYFDIAVINTVLGSLNDKIINKLYINNILQSLVSINHKMEYNYYTHMKFYLL